MGLQAILQNATNTAFNALGDLPQAFILRRKGAGGEYDPIAGRYTGGGVDTDYPCRGVILNFNYKDTGAAFRAAENSALLLTGEKKAVIEAASLAVVPTTLDRLLAEGTEYAITAVKETKPGTERFVYELQIKLA